MYVSCYLTTRKPAAFLLCRLPFILADVKDFSANITVFFIVKKNIEKKRTKFLRNRFYYFVKNSRPLCLIMKPWKN